LNQFLQYRQPYQLHTSIHLSISAILAPPTRASSRFSPIAILPLFFFQPRAPRARFFRALFTLFRGSRPRGPLPAHARDIFSRFWLPLHAQQLLAVLLFSNFSLF
jgi:hypothetical protein